MSYGYSVLSDKLHKIAGSNRMHLVFYCPGCKRNHMFTVQADKSIHPTWEWNYDILEPTFTPSLLYPESTPRCHLYLTRGKIQFLGDCGHDLKGQTVPMVPIPDKE